ncbi:hypothetical protein MXB_1058, partial [Myxobolus squamalis]
ILVAKYHTWKYRKYLDKSCTSNDVNRDTTLVLCLKDLDTFDFVNIFVTTWDLFPLYMIITIQSIIPKKSKFGNLYFYSTLDTGIQISYILPKKYDIHSKLGCLIPSNHSVSYHLGNSCCQIFECQFVRVSNITFKRKCSIHTYDKCDGKLCEFVTKNTTINAT